MRESSWVLGRKGEDMGMEKLDMEEYLKRVDDGVGVKEPGGLQCLRESLQKPVFPARVAQCGWMQGWES